MKAKAFFLLIFTLISLTGIYWISSGNSPFKTVDEVSGTASVNYTMPPGFIFSIWGLIYLGFLIYSIYQITPAGLHAHQVRNKRLLITVSILLNLVWIVIVGLSYWAAAYPLQWLMLVIALILLFRWTPDYTAGPSLQKWLSIPFALYAGWLTVALIPFTADLLLRNGWKGGPFTSVEWAVALYIAAFMILYTAERRLKHPFYLLPLIWAYFGYTQAYEGIVAGMAAFLGGILLIVFLIKSVRFFRTQD